MHLFFRLAVFGFSSALVDFDNMKSELALDDVTDLSWLQGKRYLIKLRNHLTLAEPTQIAAFFFTARIGGELLGERGKILTGTNTLQHFFCFSPGLLGIKLGMLCDVGVNLGLAGLGIWDQSLLLISRV